MNSASPPPLPRGTIEVRKRNTIFARIVVPMVILWSICFVALVLLRICGLIGIYSVPVASMFPAIEVGDHVFMEGVTYLTGKPRRGDVIVFKTNLIPALHNDEVYVKRLVGMPGDIVGITDGVITINGKQTSFYNRQGEIRYIPVTIGQYRGSDMERFVVPDQHYFVIGDNSAHSADSRLWGPVPAKSVKGRIVFCYWPPGHMGMIK